MVEKLKEFQILTGGGVKQANPKITAARLELTKVQEEIENLIDSLAGASGLLISYANEKVAELDGQRRALMKQLSDLTTAEASPGKIEMLSGYLDDWENTSFDDKRLVADGLITRIGATSEKVEIEWKI